MSAADLLNKVLVDIARTAIPKSRLELIGEIVRLELENTRLRELVRTYRAALVEHP